MLHRILVWITICGLLNAVYLYEDDEPNKRAIPTTADMEFEPVTLKNDNKFSLVKNINCDDFTKYALNCTIEAAIMYNSSRKVPPLPNKVSDWCRAVRHLTNCAIDWNSDCRDVTESHFNEESIKGHMHVVDNVCDDEWFLTRYDDLGICIEGTTDSWESCYASFKQQVEEQKNKTTEWTHYETHFILCCARAEFRRCTLDSLFDSAKCTQEQAVALQKFSVIVSEGDVFQDCDTNMMYSNCAGGDPRPSKSHLNRLMNVHPASKSAVAKTDVYDVLLMFAFI